MDTYDRMGQDRLGQTRLDQVRLKKDEWIRLHSNQTSLDYTIIPDYGDQLRLNDTISIGLDQLRLDYIYIYRFERIRLDSIGLGQIRF